MLAIPLVLFFVANVIYCLAYVVRDILWLRILTIVAAFCTFPYFYFQESPLYSALLWQSAFITINAVNLTALFLQRRPVRMTEDQQRLHLLLLRAFTPRQLLRFLTIAEWRTAEPNEKLISKGTSPNMLLLVFRGSMRVTTGRETFRYIRDGGFAGEMSYASGRPASADVVAMEPTRYLRWSKEDLESFFAKERTLKDILWTLIGTDMAEKLRTDM